MTFLCDTYRKDGRLRPHLVCLPYSIELLHEMARILNISRRYFDRDHYDVPIARVPEIMGRCTIVPTREIVRIARAKKRTNQLELEI